jgi:hypothetical protein
MGGAAVKKESLTMGGTRPPATQKVVEQPPVPSIDKAYMDEEYSRKLRRRRGHSRNNTGAASGANVAARVLMG